MLILILVALWATGVFRQDLRTRSTSLSSSTTFLVDLCQTQLSVRQVQFSHPPALCARIITTPVVATSYSISCLISLGTLSHIQQYMEQDRINLITIEGNIGVGKSTLMAFLKSFAWAEADISVVFIDKPVEEWLEYGLLQNLYDQNISAEAFQYAALSSVVAHTCKAIMAAPSGTKLFIAELIYKMDCPFDDDETCDIWWEIYEEQWRPIAEEFEDLARKGFEKLIAKGKDEKQHSPAIDLAYQTLNKLDPFNYPDVKMESRGEPGLKGLPKPRPVGLPTSTEDAAPPAPAPPPNESSGEPEVPTDTETPGTEAPAPPEEPASQPDPAPAEDSPWGAPQ